MTLPLLIVALAGVGAALLATLVVRAMAPSWGLVDHPDAQRKLHATLLDRTQAIADRYADSAALLQALGGGWWKEQPPASAATR